MTMIRIALFEPEIPQNTGTLLRLGACLGIEVDIVEPCGFAFSDRKMRRAGMDYVDKVSYVRHDSWEAFREKNDHRRLVLLTPRAPISYVDFTFDKGDTLLLGRESDGVPPSVYDEVHHRVTIPMMPDVRSLNVALAGALVLGEALRQTNGLPRLALNI